MPRPVDRARPWNELSAAEKGAIIRQYGGAEYEATLAGANGGAGMTDEQLGNTPMLWPQVNEGPTGTPLEGDQAGDYYIGTLRSEGNPVMGQIDAGEYGGETPVGEVPGQTGGDGVSNANYSDLGYNPNRGLSEFDFDNYTGVRPGVAIDLEKYDYTPEELATIQDAKDRAAELTGRDINRFAVDPNTMQATDAFTYDPNTADIYQTELGGIFDPTRDQLGYANQLTGYAADINGAHIGDAAQLQAAAARGESPLFADARLQRDADRMFAQQMMAASRARGTSSAGLAALAASNNAMFGLNSLTNDANMARIAEMQQARDSYANTGLNIRQGDLAAANQATSIGQALYGVNNAELGGSLANTDARNQGSQYNTAQQNVANQYNTGQLQTAAGQTSAAYNAALEKNRDVAMAAEDKADQYGMAYGQQAQAADQFGIQNRITGEQNFDESVRNTAAVLGNIYTGNASNQTQLSAQATQRKADQEAGVLGAIGTAAGLLATASDERIKDVGQRVPPADFTKIREHEWAYDENAPPDLEGIEGTGGMAHQWPKDMTYKDGEGILRLNPTAIIRRQSGAIGQLQREVAQLKGGR